VAYGFALILVVVFMPQGIVGLFQNRKLRLPPRWHRLIAPAAAAVQSRSPDLISMLCRQLPIPEGEAILECRGLTKDFGGLVALSGVDLRIGKGEIFSLIGPNGAGKTTLFNLVSGVYPPSAGSIRFRGEEISGLRHSHQMCRRGVGRTFQIVKPFGKMTVLENVMVGAFCRDRDPGLAREEALKIIAFTGLTGRIEAQAHQLTIADRKRLEFARALATKPDLLLLDEVIAGLNPTEAAQVEDMIRSIRDQGITVFLIEHIMQSVMSLSDRILILHHGEKIMEGVPREVASDPRVIQAYLGEEYALASD